MKPDPAGNIARAEEASPPDASTRDVLLYALSNVEGGFCNLVPGVLQQILIVVFLVNPVLTGFMLAIMFLIGGIFDPVMAYVSDNCRTRWGRRRPFIMIGAAGRLLTILVLLLLFPTVDFMVNNQQLAQRDLGGRNPEKTTAQAEEPPTATAEDRTSAGDDSAKAQGGGAQKLAPPAAPAASTPFDNLVAGFKALTDDANRDQRSLVLYVMIGLVIFTLFSGVAGTPYYAMGIELNTTYEGRTRLNVYRSVMDKALGAINPWILPFVFLTVWHSAIQGFLVVAAVFAVLGIASTAIMVYFVREPNRPSSAVHESQKERLGFFRSLWITIRNPHFLRVVLIYQIIGVGAGLFSQFNFYLNVYWVASGAAKGSTLWALANTVGWLVAIVALPLMKRLADRFEKHRAVAFGVLMMLIGSVANWWLLTPASPYLQLLSPLPFAFGISGFYAIMGAMMADVTDLDEIETGQRRGGMFGAAGSLLGKIVYTFTPILSASLLVVSGFDAGLGFDQPEEIFTRMRLMYCFGPVLFYVVAIIFLLTYPLTRARMRQVQAELTLRRERNLST